MVDYEHMRLQFARLARHTEYATAGFDHITYLDLAHSLRIWTDMKSDVDAHLAATGHVASFTSYSPTKVMKKALRGSNSITLKGGARIAGLGKLEAITITDKVLSEEEVEATSRAALAALAQGNSGTLTFTNWLGSEIFEARINTGDQPRLGISIERMIKRVANFLGASHPKGTQEDDELQNKYDVHVQALTDMEMMGVPVSYYQLLNFAQVIVEILGPVFG
jgi:hypothetical protein